MISQDLKDLIEMCLTDGILELDERDAIIRRAEREGADLTEVQIYLKSEMQKRNMKFETEAAAHERERAGNRCPHCASDIPPMTKICPECGKAITGNESEGDKELYNLIKDLELALKALKTSDNSNFQANLADVEHLARKANTFYGDNKKIKIMLFDIDEEKNKVAKKFAEVAEQERLATAQQSVEKLQKLLLDKEKDIRSRPLREDEDEIFGDEIGPQLKNVIETFPVPMKKEELLVFMSYLKSKANPKGPKACYKGLNLNIDLSYAYWILFCNCIDAAKTKFTNDQEFASYFSYYEEQKAKSGGFLSKLTSLFN